METDASTPLGFLWMEVSVLHVACPLPTSVLLVKQSSRKTNIRVMHFPSSTLSLLLLCLVLVLSTHHTFGLTAPAIKAAAERSQHIHGLLNELEERLSRIAQSSHVDSGEKSIELLDVCFRVCRSLPLRSNISQNVDFPANVRSLIDEKMVISSTINDQHFFDAALWDDALDEIIRVASKIKFEGGEDHALVCEIANSILASTRILQASKEEINKLEEMLHIAVTNKCFLLARTEAIKAVKRRRHFDSTIDSVADAGAASEDDLIIKALYKCTIKELGSSLLSTNGFPASKLGLRNLIAAIRSTGSQRAAATMDRIWHAAEEEGPLILDGEAPVNKSDKTLIVAFSSLGWNGVMRPEWGATLRTAQNDDSREWLSSSSLVIAHALDTSQSWFSSNPINGEWDEGSWWDATLKELCCDYGRVCFIGESMGASAALRFSRHCTPNGTVVAFVPQIHLKDFPQSTREDFTKTRKGALCTAIQSACQDTKAEVSIHVGRDEDDLYQINYIQEVVEAHLAVDEEIDSPLPRDGNQDSLMVGNNKMRVFKHDVEGHALGAGLKLNGVLATTVVNELFAEKVWSDSGLPSVWRGQEKRYC